MTELSLTYRKKLITHFFDMMEERTYFGGQRIKKRDQIHQLNATGQGSYTGAAANLPHGGRWNLMIEEPANTWRLTATVTSFEQPVVFKSQP